MNFRQGGEGTRQRSVSRHSHAVVVFLQGGGVGGLESNWPNNRLAPPLANRKYKLLSIYPMLFRSQCCFFFKKCLFVITEMT